MKKSIKARSFVALGIMSVQPSFADVIAYPEKGQSAQQQDKDKYDCFQWAKKETGFDPQSAAGEAASSQTEQPKTGAGRGAAKGAVVGAGVGAIAGDAGKGAAIGAGAGAVGGGAKRRKQEQQVQTQAKAEQSQMDQFDKAQSTCLKGKGYSVG